MNGFISLFIIYQYFLIKKKSLWKIIAFNNGNKIFCWISKKIKIITSLLACLNSYQTIATESNENSLRTRHDIQGIKNCK